MFIHIVSFLFPFLFWICTMYSMVYLLYLIYLVIFNTLFIQFYILLYWFHFIIIVFYFILTNNQRFYYYNGWFLAMNWYYNKKIIIIIIIMTNMFVWNSGTKCERKKNLFYYIIYSKHITVRCVIVHIFCFYFII